MKRMTDDFFSEVDSFSNEISWAFQNIRRHRDGQKFDIYRRLPLGDNSNIAIPT